MEVEKVLFVASIEHHLNHFHTPYIRLLQERGYEVHTAASGNNLIKGIDRHYNIGIQRSPYNLRNLTAYWQLKKIIQKNQYKMVHCHTPNASVLARLAARKMRKKGLVVIYSAHGFHFYEGCPFLNKLIYQPIEKFMSRYTDAILTSNKEDYDAIARYRFHCKRRFLTKGVGVDEKRFHPVTPAEKAALRETMKIDPNTFVMVYPAEYNYQKNQALLIRIVAEMVKKHQDILLLLPGDGSYKAEFQKMIAKLGIQKHVRLLGFQKKVELFYAVADLSLAPSMREGLGMHIIEANCMGIPTVAARIRGHKDIITHGQNGYLFRLDSPREMAHYIHQLYHDRELLGQLGVRARKNAKRFCLSSTLKEHGAIYSQMLHSEGRKICEF